jgi:hypothetical protein
MRLKRAPKSIRATENSDNCLTAYAKLLSYGLQKLQKLPYGPQKIKIRAANATKIRKNLGKPAVAFFLHGMLIRHEIPFLQILPCHFFAWPECNEPLGEFCIGGCH